MSQFPKKTSTSVWLYDPCNLIPNYTYPLASATANAGIDVTLICGSYDYCSDLRLDERVGHVKWLSLLAGLVTKIGVSNNLIRKLAKLIDYPFSAALISLKLFFAAPRVLHIQWDRLPVFDLVVVVVARLIRTRVVFTVHDVEPLYSTRSKSWSRSFILWLAHQILVHSHQNAGQLRFLYPRASREKIKVIPFGVDLMTSARNISKSHAREHLSVHPSRFVCAFIGNIKAYKGVDSLIQAAEPLLRKYDDFEVIVAGRCEEASVREKFVRASHSLDRFRFVNSYIPESSIDTYFRAADVIILPYRKVSQSGVVFRALANGRPVIATAVGGLPEVVHSKHGWLVPPNDHRALSEAMENARGQRYKLDRMGTDAYLFVQSNNSWETAARVHLEIYSQSEVVQEVMV